MWRSFGALVVPSRLPVSREVRSLLLVGLIVGTATLAFAGGKATATPAGASCGSGLTSKIVPDYSTIYYVYNFTAACTRHDQCYSTLGRSKQLCDSEFYRNMLTSCRGAHRRDDPGSKKCLAAARLYLRAVVRLGRPFYDKAQTEARLAAFSGPYRGTAAFRAESSGTFYEDTLAITFTVSGGKVYGDLSASSIDPSGTAAVSVTILAPYGDITGTVRFTVGPDGQSVTVEGTASGFKEGLTTKATIKASRVSS